MWVHLRAAFLFIVCSSLGVLGCSGGSSAVPDASTGGNDTADASIVDAGDDEWDVPPWEPDLSVRVCGPGERRCTSETTPESCAEDGRGWVAELRCGPQEVCHPQRGECVEGCRPSDRACVSGNRYLTCDDEGNFVEETCPDEQSCLPGGVCGDCWSGESRCEDDTTVFRCLPEGGTWAYAEYCNEGYFCVAGVGECVPCGGCVGAASYLDCDGGGVGVERSCPDGTYYCLAGRGCIACVPGHQRCADAGTVEVCRSDGSGWDQAEPCTGLTVCDPATNACRPCTEGESRCIGGGRVGTCTPDGPTTVACADDEFCAQGRCVRSRCRSEVLLLVDRSGSMGGDKWAQLGETVLRLFVEHPEAAFLLLAFPGDLSAPTAPISSEEVALWFEDNAPDGNTPLQPSMTAVARRAEFIWTDNERYTRYLVLLSDGAGNYCVPTPFPIPPPVTGDCNVDGLGAATVHLRDERRVHTYAIGFDVNPAEGAVAQLVAVATNGGTSFDGYIEADDVADLEAAFEALLSDPKVCR